MSRSLRYCDPLSVKSQGANRNLYLYRGDVVKAKDGISARVVQIVCPEHPDRQWTEIHQRHGWGIAYVDLKDLSGKKVFSGNTEVLTFKHIEVWLEDEDSGLALGRAMSL